MGSENFRLENYGNVRQHHQQWANEHFAFHLDTFDRFFDQEGGRLGSPAHQMEKEAFAVHTAKAIIEGITQIDGNLVKMDTESTHISQSLKTSFKVRTYSDFDRNRMSCLYAQHFALKPSM